MQERAKALEEQKRNRMEYRQFLESCDFIKVHILILNFFHLIPCSSFVKYLAMDSFCLQVNSQWRKVQDRLEDDERCSRLEKIDRLEIFQVSIYFIGVSIYLKFMLIFDVVVGIYSWPRERRGGTEEDTEGAY